MTGPEHYQAAEAILDDLRQHQEAARWSIADVLAQATLAELPQGYGLLPVTRQLLHRLADAKARSFSDTFAVSRAALRHWPDRFRFHAYLGAEMFGGTGTQALVVWCGDQIVLGPETTGFLIDVAKRPPSAMGVQPRTPRTGRQQGRCTRRVRCAAAGQARTH